MVRKFEKISYEMFKSNIIDLGINTAEEIIANIYNNIKLPERKTKFSAGYDFSLPFAITIMSHECLLIPTGIKVSLNEDEYLAMHVRSSLGIKYGITLANATGIIDSDYYNNSNNEGHIYVKLVNNGDSNISLQAGDAISQGIISKFYIVDNEEIIKNERDGGIGST